MRKFLIATAALIERTTLFTAARTIVFARKLFESHLRDGYSAAEIVAGLERGGHNLSQDPYKSLARLLGRVLWFTIKAVLLVAVMLTIIVVSVNVAPRHPLILALFGSFILFVWFMLAVVAALFTRLFYIIAG